MTAKVLDLTFPPGSSVEEPLWSKNGTGAAIIIPPPCLRREREHTECALLLGIKYVSCVSCTPSCCRTCRI